MAQKKDWSGIRQQAKPQAARATDQILMRGAKDPHRNGTMQRVNVRFAPEDVERLERIADAEGRTVSGLIRQVVTRYMDDWEDTSPRSTD